MAVCTLLPTPAQRNKGRRVGVSARQRRQEEQGGQAAGRPSRESVWPIRQHDRSSRRANSPGKNPATTQTARALFFRQRPGAGASFLGGQRVAPAPLRKPARGAAGVAVQVAFGAPARGKPAGAGILATPPREAGGRGGAWPGPAGAFCSVPVCRASNKKAGQQGLGC